MSSHFSSEFADHYLRFLFPSSLCVSYGHKLLMVMWAWVHRVRYVSQKFFSLVSPFLSSTLYLSIELILIHSIFTRFRWMDIALLFVISPSSTIVILLWVSDRRDGVIEVIVVCRFFVVLCMELFPVLKRSGQIFLTCCRSPPKLYVFAKQFFLSPIVSCPSRTSKGNTATNWCNLIGQIRGGLYERSPRWRCVSSQFF